MASDATVTKLNSILRGEISAVETYRQALERIKNAALRTTLQQNYQAHQQRVTALRQRVVAVGGTPSDGSGMWGAFAKLVEGGASVLGDKAAISALEEGEDHGLRDYRIDLSDLDATSRTLIEQELLPGQQQTHRALSTIKHSLSLLPLVVLELRSFF